MSMIDEERGEMEFCCGGCHDRFPDGPDMIKKIRIYIALAWPRRTQDCDMVVVVRGIASNVYKNLINSSQLNSPK